MLNKIILGTAQFGLDYGISNTHGKIQKTEAYNILDAAKLAHITLLDTAPSYGNAEEVIGEYLDKKPNSFQIISKIPHCSENEVARYIDASLTNLKTTSLYGVLIHDFDKFNFNQKLFEQLLRLKDSHKISKVGFSLYHPSEIEQLLDKKFTFDIVQIPFNILDQRFSKILSELKKLKIEITVRSVFLQGLILMDTQKIPEKLHNAKGVLEKFHVAAKQLQQPVEQLALDFALRNDKIDRVIIGVESLETLTKNITCIKNIAASKNAPLIDFNEFAIDDEAILIPSNW